MLDAVSLDQLRVFICAVEEGSFSAAARKLRRAQSAVSEMVSALEAQIGVPLFDRGGRYPKLTGAGAVLLADARGIVSGVDFMKARAKGMSAGLEPELSAVVDVFFPMEALTSAAKEFREKFPGIPLRLYVEALGGVFQPLLDGRASLGIAGPLPQIPAAVTPERLSDVGLVMVAAREHPLAAFEGPIPKSELARHVQLVLTDRSELSAGREYGVVSPATWRLADLFAKHAFLLNGLGFGGMPLHTVKPDIDSGKLVVLKIEDMPAGGLMLPMYAVYLTTAPPGPAGRWLIERLKLCPGKRLAAEPETASIGSRDR
jgi:DNA-binding transcriptional LysR family regulator